MKLAPARLLARLLFGRLHDGQRQEAFAAALAEVSSAAWRARLRAVLEVDAAPLLAQVTAPVLYLKASEDRVVPPEATELITRLAPHARVVHFPTPHFLLQCLPQAAAAEVWDLVMSLCAEGPRPAELPASAAGDLQTGGWRPTRLPGLL